MYISRYSILLVVLLSVFFTACKSTKFVAKGSYLLDGVTIKSDVKDLPVEDLESYLRQTPNSEVLRLYKMRLNIYNFSPRDSSTWMQRFFRRIFMNVGEEPVIYDPLLTKLSAQQLNKVLVNKGYMNARVDTALRFKGRKVKVKYLIESNQPYKIRNYRPMSGYGYLDSIAGDKLKTLVRKGLNFDIDLLDKERERIAIHMRNTGYYNFSKDLLVFSADSALKTHEINIKLDLKPSVKRTTAIETWPVFTRYKVGKVFYVLQQTNLTDSLGGVQLDTVEIDSNFLIDAPSKFVSLDALMHNSYIEPYSFFSDQAVDMSISLLGKRLLRRCLILMFTWCQPKR
jgi:hypothetical protein